MSMHIDFQTCISKCECGNMYIYDVISYIQTMLIHAHASTVAFILLLKHFAIPSQEVLFFSVTPPSPPAHTYFFEMIILDLPLRKIITIILMHFLGKQTLQYFKFVIAFTWNEIFLNRSNNNFALLVKKINRTLNIIF